MHLTNMLGREIRWREASCLIFTKTVKLCKLKGKTSAVSPNRRKNNKSNFSTVLIGWAFRKFQVPQALRTNASVLLLPQNRSDSPQQ